MKKHKKLNKIQEYKKIERLVKEAFKNTAEYIKKDTKKSPQISINY